VFSGDTQSILSPPASCLRHSASCLFALVRPAGSVCARGCVYPPDVASVIRFLARSLALSLRLPQHALIPLPTPRLRLQHPHLPPFLRQLSHPLTQPLRGHQLLHDEQIKLPAKRKEVGEQAVEVRLDREVEDGLKVGVIEVRKDAEEVLVDVFGGVGE
jgi:hypothetical protein